jgi:hypothetical protein
MDLAVRWHRLLRALAFLAGGLVFSIAIIFIFSNLTPIQVHWRIPATVGYTYDLTLKGVNTWLLAILPLLFGAVIGYLYQTPARMHHVREALRHRHRVHELEHELKEIRKSLDKVLMMPEDGTLAVQASLLPELEHREADAEEDDLRLPEEPPAVALLGAAPSSPASGKVIRATRRKPVEAGKGLLGALKAEIASIHLPTNGKPAGKPVTAKAAEAGPRPVRQAKAAPPARPGRRKEAKKPS